MLRKSSHQLLAKLFFTVLSSYNSRNFVTNIWLKRFNITQTRAYLSEHSKGLHDKYDEGSIQGFCI